MLGVVVAFIFLFGLFLYVWWVKRIKDAPFVPMEVDVVERIINIADVNKNDVFYDLGSGDGRLVIAAAMRGARANGVELDRVRVLYSRLWILLLRLNSKATIVQKNIFDTDLSSATVVCTYLLQETNDKLQSKLEQELKPGTKVVSLAFEFEGWMPKKIDRRGNKYGPIFYYEI